MNLSRLLRSPEPPRTSIVPKRDLPQRDSPQRVVPKVEETDEHQETSSSPSLSFIVIAEAAADGCNRYVSDSVTDVLGYSPEECIGRPAWFYAHPEDAAQLYAIYQKMIFEDKAACLIYLRVKHKNPSIGYLLASVTCTRVGRHLVGGVGVATSNANQMHHVSTAREVFVIAPEAKNLIFARWNDGDAVTIPNYPKPTETPTPESTTGSSEDDSQGSPIIYPLSLEEFGPQLVNSRRTALVLDRFSVNCTVLHITNDDIFSTPVIMGRSFFDFVAARDEKRIRLALDIVKGWGVSEIGGPSDGGFAFNKFGSVLQGKDSSSRSTGRSSRKSSQNDKLNSHPYAEALPNGQGSTIDDRASMNRTRLRQRSSMDRIGRSSTARDRQDELKVDAIFSPQSDGIIVILRPSPK